MSLGEKPGNVSWRVWKGLRFRVSPEFGRKTPVKIVVQALGFIAIQIIHTPVGSGLSSPTFGASTQSRMREPHPRVSAQSKSIPVRDILLWKVFSSWASSPNRSPFFTRYLRSTVARSMFRPRPVLDAGTAQQNSAEICARRRRGWAELSCVVLFGRTLNPSIINGLNYTVPRPWSDL